MEEMREIIKIDIWGYTAHFRIYGNQNFCDSYPILPPSTFLGILKDLIGERPPEPFTLAIKGEFENLFFVLTSKEINFNLETVGSHDR